MIRLFNWCWAKWNAYRRALDMRYLWPSCKKYARDLDHAKAAFAVHAFNDEAWMCLGKDEVYRRIDRLT